jgi:hypothetical protein
MKVYVKHFKHDILLTKHNMMYWDIIFCDNMSEFNLSH